MTAMNRWEPWEDDEASHPRGTSWVWALPNAGMQWCDCGENHELTRDHVWKIVNELGLQRCLELTYLELTQVAMTLWRLDEPCLFFSQGLDRAIMAVYGSFDRHYRIGAALDIVGYFSKNWQGCPEDGLNY